ncbi:phage holin family protein [Xenophilus arseniciresistens]|uniref:Phage holin family protein n=1 Tax=Xenophilus arseniciresistens TaxID=1283306 RepID=A0AAE3SYJ3_9BURK|nr:phage holin family protein [Xenophilus arseniciresistens]MDA7416162.1 phage holin family protein [Xenophilus arseniciresistens]
MRQLLALLGIDRRIAHLRAVIGEGAMAAEDRAQLLRMAWDEEKLRLRRLLLLLLAVLGLTFMMTALLSVAIIVHFWDSPSRSTAAWLVALAWLLFWGAALWALLATIRETPPTVAVARDELARDIDWLGQRFGDDEDAPPKVRPATRQELLDRIEGQRRRLALQERMEAMAEEVPPPESPSNKAVRLAREHPVVAGAAAAVVIAAVGPRRVLRVAGWVLPILWKLR